MIPPSLVRGQLSTASPPPTLYTLLATIGPPSIPPDPLKDLRPPQR